MKIKRILRVVLTWPFNDRTDYDRYVGAQVPIPLWVLVALLAAVVVSCYIGYIK